MFRSLNLAEKSLQKRLERSQAKIQIRTMEDFKVLLKELHLIAVTYPINLHVLLATVPVQINTYDVKNIAIYIECGASPTFHVFTKATRSSLDPVYPGTITSEYSDFRGVSDSLIGLLLMRLR